IYFYNGDLQRALAFSKRAVALDGNNSWYLLQLARIYQQRGNIDSTIIVYEKIVKQKPYGYDAQLNLALLHLQNKDPKKALKILNDVKRLYGNNEEIILALFNAYSSSGEHSSCIRLLEEAITQYPEDIRFLGLLAEYYVKLGDFARALPIYNQLLTLDPGNEKGLLSLIEYHRLAQNYNELQEISQRYIADSAYLYQNKIEVIANLIVDQKLLKEHGPFIHQLIQTMDSLYKSDFRVQTLYSDFYLRTKNYPLAKEKLTYLVSNYKTTMPYWTQLIFVLGSLNENEQIVNYCDKAIATFGNNPFFYLYKGIALSQLKQRSIAIVVLQDGLKYTAKNSELLVQFYSYLAELFNEVADYTHSDAFFRKAIDLSPQNVHLLNNYSYYLAERNQQLDLASDYIKTCLKIEPSSYSYLDTYGWILYKVGKLKAALKVLESSLKAGGSKDKTILGHMAVVLYASGNKEEANKYYKLVTELGEPDNALKQLFNK
ncbi:MAG TPA: tetratricopeptide repeat protein, partial [Bacteroidales bacterium]|nr:tetratricopeptide repeat protein [Bacteroidales bacterium]